MGVGLSTCLGGGTNIDYVHFVGIGSAEGGEGACQRSQIIHVSGGEWAHGNLEGLRCALVVVDLEVAEACRQLSGDGRCRVSLEMLRAEEVSRSLVSVLHISREWMGQSWQNPLMQLLGS